MASPTRRRLRAGLVSAGLAAIAFTVSAQTARAAAAIVRFGPITTTFTDTVSDDCRPGVSGTLTATEVVAGQIVHTPPPSSGSIFSGQDTTTLSIAFSDGSTGIGTSSFRFRALRSTSDPRTTGRSSRSSPSPAGRR